MKNLILVIIMMSSQFANSEDKTPIYKSWKIFRSDYGYEFKYPDCWSLEPARADEPGSIKSTTREISMHEARLCERPQFYPPYQNSVNVIGGWNPLKSKDEGLKKLRLAEMGSDTTVKRDDWKIYKTLTIGSDNAFVYVERFKMVGYEYIQWQMDLYCPTQLIRITGPAIKDPGESYNKKFKAGDLALPEPEKTIYESIRCVEPKKQIRQVKKTK